MTALLPSPVASHLQLGWERVGWGGPSRCPGTQKPRPRRQEELGSLFLKPNLADSCPLLPDGPQDIPFQGTIPTRLQPKLALRMGLGRWVGIPFISWECSRKVCVCVIKYSL